MDSDQHETNTPESSQPAPAFVSGVDPGAQTPPAKKPKMWLIIALALFAVLIIAVGTFFAFSKLYNTASKVEQVLDQVTSSSYASHAKTFTIDYPSNWQLRDNMEYLRKADPKTAENYDDDLTLISPSYVPFAEWSTTTYSETERAGKGTYTVVNKDSLYMGIRIESGPWSEVEEAYQNYKKTQPIPGVTEDFTNSNGQPFAFLTTIARPWVYNPQDKTIWLTKDNNIYIRQGDKYVKAYAIFNPGRDEARSTLSDDFVFEEHPEVLQAKEILKSIRFD